MGKINHKARILRTVRGTTPIYGFIYFKTKEAQQRALSTPMQTFGIALRNQNAKTENINSKRCLYIGNIPPDTTYDEFKQFLTLRLTPEIDINDIIDIGVISTPFAKPADYNAFNKIHGYVFVEFKTHEIALLASRLLLKQEIIGYQVHVGWSTRRTSAYKFNVLQLPNDDDDIKKDIEQLNLAANKDEAERILPSWWEDSQNKIF